MFVYRKKNSIIITIKEIISEEIEFCYKVPKNGFVKIKELGTLVETETMSIEKNTTSLKEKTKIINGLMQTK